MFSFIKKYAETLNGVDVYGNIGLMLCMFVFIVAVLVAVKASKGYVTAMAELPLNDSSKN